MKKVVIVLVLALMSGSGAYAGNPGDQVGVDKVFDTEVKVTESLQFVAAIKKGKAADGTCCDDGDITKISFDLAQNAFGTLSAVPIYIFLATSTNSQPYTVQYSATDLTDPVAGDMDQSILFTSVISAVDASGNDMTTEAGASVMDDRIFSTGGNLETVFTSPDAGQYTLVQMIAAVNGYDSGGSKAFSAGNVPDGNTPAGTYAGTVTYSAVLR